MINALYRIIGRDEAGARSAMIHGWATKAMYVLFGLLALVVLSAVVLLRPRKA